MKGALSHAVSAGRNVMRNASEVYAYCTENLSVEDGTKRMLCWKFFFVTEKSLEEKCAIVKEIAYVPIKDTKLHQATTIDKVENDKMLVHNFTCFCEVCEGRFSECEITTNTSNPSPHIFHTMKSEITYRQHNFTKQKKRQKKKGDNLCRSQ